MVLQTHEQITETRHRQEGKEDATNGHSTGHTKSPDVTFYGIMNENDPVVDRKELLVKQEEESKEKYKAEIMWRNVFIATVFHACTAHLLFRVFTGRMPLHHILYLIIYGYISHLGITAGAHRLWAHRSYKAKTPLKILLLFLQICCVQYSVYQWVYYHRAHHKFCATNADPHNIKRGLFFAHIGWLLTKEHPEVEEKRKLLDLSDLENDPLVMWQYKYHEILFLLGVPIVPTLFHKWILGATWLNALIGGIGVYMLSIHVTWLVNSYAHMWGDKPYDKECEGTDNSYLGLLSIGEGWHNYHHVFPWDYQASELGLNINLTTAFIDFMAMIGWAYDLKTVPKDSIKARVLRTGDGSHPVWGWGDKDIPEEHIRVTKRILN